MTSPSTMTTTTYRRVTRVQPNEVLVTVDGEHAIVVEVVPLDPMPETMGGKVRVTYQRTGGDVASFDYPAGVTVPVVIPDPRARVRTHVDDIAPGDIVVMPMADPRFPREVEVLVEVLEVGEPHRDESGARAQTIDGVTISSRIPASLTLDPDNGQADVVGHIDMLAA